MKMGVFRIIILLFLIGNVSSCSFISQTFDDFGIMKSFGGHSLEPVYFKGVRIQNELERMRLQEESNDMINLLPSILPEKNNE